MKAAYRGDRQCPARRPLRRAGLTARRLPPDDFDWQAVTGRRDPVPAVLELQERLGGRRVLITGGGGSIGRAPGHAPRRVSPGADHPPRLTRAFAGRRPPRLARPGRSTVFAHGCATCASRGAWPRRLRAPGRDVVFHLAAYKHVDWAEIFPEEFVDTNLHGSWNVLRAADAAGVETVVVASTDKAALAASFYGRTKRFMEQLTAAAARPSHARPDRRQAGERAGQRGQRLGTVPAPGQRAAYRSP